MYITQGLHRAIQQTPDKTAFVSANRSFSFAQVGDRVARLAGALQQLGMKPGDRIALLSMNSDRYLEAMLGIIWGGGAVNPCNIRWSAAEIIYSLKDSTSTMLFVDETFKPMIPQILAECDFITHVIDFGDGTPGEGQLDYEALIEGTDPVADAGRSDDDLAGLFYTGGTTGFPKGVMLSHTGLMSSSLAIVADGACGRDGIYLHAAPMFHLADFGISLCQLIMGNTHAFVPAFTPAGVAQAFVDWQVSDVLLVPTMIQMLLDDPGARAIMDGKVALKRITYGASPMPEAVLSRAIEAFPGVQFSQAYGMTELSPLATLSPGWAHTEEGRKAGKLRSAGRAGLCTEVKIVDEDGREVPRGTVGEVIVRGPNVMQGYWNQPDLTQKAIKKGWMHTGDAGRMDEDGFVFIVDRVKDMIVSGGENVYSAEVENALAQHPAVAASAVIGIPSAEWGEAVHAVVVLKPGQSATEDELRTHCKGLIAGYKCPRSVSFADELPLSGAGKVLKTELRKPYWENDGQRFG